MPASKICLHDRFRLVRWEKSALRSPEWRSGHICPLLIVEQGVWHTCVCVHVNANTILSFHSSGAFDQFLFDDGDCPLLLPPAVCCQSPGDEEKPPPLTCPPRAKDHIRMELEWNGSHPFLVVAAAWMDMRRERRAGLYMICQAEDSSLYHHFLCSSPRLLSNKIEMSGHLSRVSRHVSILLPGSNSAACTNQTTGDRDMAKKFVFDATDAPRRP